MITLFSKRIRLFRPRSIWIRRVVQWFFFLLIALISVNHTLLESGKGIALLSSASLHAVCPVDLPARRVHTHAMLRKSLLMRWLGRWRIGRRDIETVEA
jgi:hypothetical protein